MKLILALVLLSTTIFAQNFSKRSITGLWELSSAKLNRTVAFGKYLGKTRGETIQLLFNVQGRLKVLKNGDIYNYEIVNGELKIYESKFYRNNYEIKQKNRYDLFKIVGNVEGCQEWKITKKKIPGYKSRHNLKACKIQGLPQPTVQVSSEDYEF